MSEDHLANLQQVLNMVLFENKGQQLTEALCIGIEKSVLYYFGRLPVGESHA